MGDHLALLVDRLLTESTLEANIKGPKLARNSPDSASSVVPISEFSLKKKKGVKLMECRICQEEDEASNMETPCSCCGSLKYAHRKCVQKWCNEKGDTTCEICLQKFTPGYTAPPELFRYGGIPMNFRGSWEISSRDLHDSQVITMVPSGRGFMDSDDDYYYPSARSTACYRSVAIIFTSLLVLRHSLPLMIGEDAENSITFFSLLLLRTAGILIPIAVMVKILTIFHRRRRRQHDARDIPITGADQESLSSSSSIYRPQPHLVRVSAVDQA